MTTVFFSIIKSPDKYFQSAAEIKGGNQIVTLYFETRSDLHLIRKQMEDVDGNTFSDEYYHDNKITFTMPWEDWVSRAFNVGIDEPAATVCITSNTKQAFFYFNSLVSKQTWLETNVTFLKACLWPMTITNNHHFARGVTLNIDAKGKMTWLVDKTAQRNKYGSRSIDGEGIMTLDLNSTGAELCNAINIMFEFTGSDPLIVPDRAGWTPSEVRQAVIDLIYATPLERKINIVEVDLCRCNMGHCADVTGVTIEKEQPATYGDLFKLFGMRVDGNEDDPTKHYEYPDSVWLFLEPFTKVPPFVRKTHDCWSDAIPCTVILNPDEEYISYSYCR